MRRNDGSHDREREADLAMGNMRINVTCKVDSEDMHLCDERYGRPVKFNQVL